MFLIYHPSLQQDFFYRTKNHGFNLILPLENQIFAQEHHGFVEANVLHKIFFTFP
jgi:hypothetical protein